MSPNRTDRRQRTLLSIYHVAVGYTALIVTAVLLILLFGGH